MSWKMTGEPKVRKLTKTLVDQFAGMTPAPHDRPLNSTRSSILKVAIEKGVFRTCEWASAYCEETKQTYRVNGKHTSNLLATMNGTLPKGMCVIVEEYYCDTLEDVASLYGTFDTRSSARSTGDINRIWAAAVPELVNVCSKAVNLAVTGMAAAIWPDDFYKRPAEEKAKLLLDHGPFVVWLEEMTKGDSKKVGLIHRGPVATAMFMTYSKAKGAASEFWTAVRNETGPKPDCPDRKLARFLITATVRSTRGFSHARRADKQVSAREMTVKCIHAWNAWRKGENTSLAYYADAKIPTVL